MYILSILYIEVISERYNGLKHPSSSLLLPERRECFEHTSVHPSPYFMCSIVYSLLLVTGISIPHPEVLPTIQVRRNFVTVNSSLNLSFLGKDVSIDLPVKFRLPRCSRFLESQYNLPQHPIIKSLTRH